MATPGLLTLASLVFGVGLFFVKHLRRRADTILDNIPGPSSASFWTGNLRQFMDRRGWAFHGYLAHDFGPVVRMNGFLNRPVLYVYDPVALTSIVLKDQDIYEETSSFIATNLLVFGPGLLSTLGDHHRKQRKLLNPVFSIKHMRHMLPIFYRVIDQLRQAMVAQVIAGPRDVDILNWTGRTALELVGQGGLGYSFDTLIEDRSNTLGDALKELPSAIFAIDTLQRLSPYTSMIGPPVFRRCILDMIPHKGLQKLKYVTDTMFNAATGIFNAKKAALQAGDGAVLRQVGEGKDIFSILMKANIDVAEEDKLPEYELIAQMATLIFAAMDTTSNALSRILHILAQTPDAQERLRQEIVAATAGDKELSYDMLMQLPFLDAVCRETLRLYPPASIVTRIARKDTVMPLSQPIHGCNGRTIHEVPIPKGTVVLIGIMGSNHNKALWGEDALEWKPDRWLSPLPQALVDARIPGVYSNLMSFMGGGRACIGFKFSELEMKAVLCTLIPSFSFALPKEEITWNISGVNFPSMNGEAKPHMMLQVAALEDVKA